MQNFSLGFQTLSGAVARAELTVEGVLPAWLGGSLIRNGPACFEAGGQALNHWFDGYSALRRLHIADGKVFYSVRMLESDAYKRSRSLGAVASMEFGTSASAGLTGRIRQIFAPAFTDNANVNVSLVGGRLLAMTETPHLVEFDGESLTTLGRFRFDDSYSYQLTTAHPLLDRSDGTTYNLGVSLGMRCAYSFYRTDRTGRRTLVGAVPVRKPAYMHSFAMTRGYLILTEFPLRVDPLELLFSGKPYIENYRWRAGAARFIVLDKASGNLCAVLEGPPCFAFHQVNAFEEAGEVVVDLAAYADATILSALSLARLKTEAPVPAARAVRFRLDIKAKKLVCEDLPGEAIEFPRVDPRSASASRHSNYWAAAVSPGAAFLDSLVRVDLAGEVTSWRQPDCFTGEPVFVPGPGASPDTGLILAVALDARRQLSFLIVLESMSMREVARAYLPQIEPYAFHGIFMEKSCDS